ncbi:MAG: ABC transporter permease [bacterium]|nr:MAG: ABC transporter permease [bacterium]
MRKGSLWIISRIAACDFKLTWKERSTIFWIFVMPLAFTLFFGLSFRRGSRSGPSAQLTIENNDTGFLSEDLIDALRAENLSIVDELPEGENAIRTLVIPADFTKRVLNREQTVLLVKREEDANINASEAASAAIFKGIVRVTASLVELEADIVAGDDERFTNVGDSISGSLWLLVGGSPGDLESIEARIDSLLVREPLVTVRSAKAGGGAPIPMGFQGSVPGNLVMFVLMAMVFSGAYISLERQTGILRRIGMTPASRGEVIIGKILGRVYVACLQIAFLLLVGKFVFRITLGNSPHTLILIMVAFAFCTGAFSIFFGSFFKNPDQVTGFAIITTLVMSALGGCWWPLEVVSRPFKIVAFLLPTGWAINGIHKVISFGYGFTEAAMNVVVLFAFGLLFILLGARKLKWMN